MREAKIKIRKSAWVPAWEMHRSPRVTLDVPIVPNRIAECRRRKMEMQRMIVLWLPTGQ
jgi:hypothetical protein